MMERLILAEYGDVEIMQSSNGRDALLNLTKHSFDLVVCNTDLEDISISELRLEMIECPSENKYTEIIALAESTDDLQELIAAGFKHLIILPFDPASLIDKINQVCDPRKWRQNDRFYIPDSKVSIEVWGMEADARMINISLGGVLVEVSGDRSELLLQNNPKLSLKVRTPGFSYDIRNLPSKLDRLNVIQWNKNHKPTTMRVAYIFLGLDENSTIELEQLFQLVKETQQHSYESSFGT